MRVLAVLAGSAVFVYTTLAGNTDPALITLAAGMIAAPSLNPPKPPATQPMVDFRQARLEGLDD